MRIAAVTLRVHLKIILLLQMSFCLAVTNKAFDNLLKICSEFASGDYSVSNKNNNFPTKEAPISSRAGHMKDDFFEHESRNLYFIWTGVILQSHYFE